MSKLRVLFFVDRMRAGGIQALLISLFKNFDKCKIECELLLLDDGLEYDLENVVAELGVKIYKLNGIWLNHVDDVVKYKRAVDAFFEQHHDYDAVHMNSGPKNFYILQCAKKYGIPVRVVHSHNAGYQTKSKMQRLVGDFCKYPLKSSASVYLACSDLAAKWMFGNSKAIILPNAIDVKSFAYNETVRKKIRSEFGVKENSMVIGNIGRFTSQKNHKFLIDIYNEIYQKMPNSILVLVGIGELEPTVKKQVQKLGLEKNVKFLEYRTDVADIVQGMDILLMPSLYEGFPVTAIEAQAAGLPCVFSDAITRDAKIIDAVEYVPLSAPVSVWTDITLKTAKFNNRKLSSDKLRNSEYDIQSMIKSLMEIYTQ